MNSKVCQVVRYVSWIDEETLTLMKGRSKQTAIKAWHHPTLLSDQEVGQQDFEGLLWGQRVCDPSPFHVKAQGLRRGDTGPRTHHKSQGRSKEMAENELLLGMP